MLYNNSKSLILIFGIIFHNAVCAQYRYGSYSPDASVAYANKWVQDNPKNIPSLNLRNKNYPDLSNVGGDCTNFISQNLSAGGWKNTATTSKISDQVWWYLDKTNYSQTWSVAHGFFRHINGGYSEDKLGKSFEGWSRWDFTSKGVISANYGDIISMDLPGNGYIDHNTIVTGFYRRPDGSVEPRVSYHSTDRKNIQISAIQSAYPKARFYRFGPVNACLIIKPSYIFQ